MTHPPHQQGASHGPPGPAGMDSVEAYLADIAAAIQPLPPRELPLAHALGAVLADDVTARYQLPPFDNSSMDGYAVRAADLAAASAGHPVVLKVDGEITAGDTGEHNLVPGLVMRITTGARIPTGADAVVPVELTDGGTERVTFTAPVEAHAAVRDAGSDAQPGDLLIARGTRLGPVHIGLLAAAGHDTVLARPRPRVTVISTGNELVEPGAAVIPGQIWESNATMLAAAAREAGCPARRHSIVRDDAGALLAAVQDALADADLLVTSGGVSMGGEHDVVKAALSTLGTVRFRKVAMQPGMPQGFGTLGSEETPVFTLPGNPVSSYVSFCLFVRPALDLLQGAPASSLVPRRARLGSAVRSPAGRRSYLRVVLDVSAGVVAPVTGQSSHQLASLARANALAIVPEDITSLPAGTEVDVLELP